MRIRPAGVFDAQALLNIYRSYIPTNITFETVPPSTDEFAQRIRTISAVYPYLIWENDEGQILGYAYAHRTFSRAAYEWNAELSVYLAPDARKRGIGTRLYRAVLECLREMGVRLAYAVVVSPNPASERLHEKLGFLRRAEFPCAGYKNGRWCTTIWFEYPLLSCESKPEPIIPFCQLDPQLVRGLLSRYEQGETLL